MANLELYRVFYTVAKCGSLTRAAEALYISQPAVSQSIKQLENQLGVSLFVRNHRGMELTEQGGKLIFSKVEAALRLFDESENLIAQLKTNEAGELRVGASDTIFEYFLADKIAQFHKKHPAVKIDLLSGITPETIEDLKAGKCDVAFVNLPIEKSEDVVLKGGCMRLNDVFVAGERFSELKDRAVSLEEIKNLPLIMLEGKTVARQSLNGYLKSLGVELEPSVEVGSWDLMKRLVQSDMGIGVIPREYAVREIEDGSLFEIKTDPALPPRSVGMLLPKNRVMTFAVRAFLELLSLEK